MHEKLNRKERRALQFGTDEQRAAVRAKIDEVVRAEKAAKATVRTVTEKDGIILLPLLTDADLLDNALSYMIPYTALDEKYRGHSAYVTAKSGCSVNHYRAFLNDWFYRGLDGDPIFHFKENVAVVWPDALAKDIPNDALLRKTLLRYLGFLLGSWESAHEHKMAYCTYVLDTCLSFISWAAAPQEEHP